MRTSEKRLRAKIEKVIDTAYPWDLEELFKKLSVSEENYIFLKDLYCKRKSKWALVYQLREAYLPEKARDLFDLFRISEIASIRHLAVKIGKEHGFDLSEIFAEMSPRTTELLKVKDGKMAFLSAYTDKYRVDISEDTESAVIYNSTGDNVIFVDYEGDEYTVAFSFQHTHLDKAEEAVEWIDEIMSDTRFPIEFFANGKNVFGGDIMSYIIENLTYETLNEHFRVFDGRELHETADSFKIRSWSGEKDIDAEIVSENGNIYIKKTNV
jgi:hypothetical protein